MDPLRHLPELLRVAEQDDVARARPERERVGERHLPRLVDEQRVDDALHVFAREEPRGAGEQQHVLLRCGEVRLVPRRRHEVGLVQVALLQPAELEALLARRLLDLGDEVVDRLVARRRDADATAEAHQAHDQPRAGVGLPRSGRALDHEVATAEARDELLRRFEVVLRERRRERLADEDRLGCKVRVAAGEHRACETPQRGLLHPRVVRPARDQRRRERHVLERWAAPQRERARLLVERLDLPRRPAGRRVEDVAPRPEVVLLRREG